MYFISIKTTDIFINNSELKKLAIDNGFKYIFNYKLKRWEFFISNSKKAKKRTKAMKDFAYKNNCIFDEWETRY